MVGQRVRYSCSSLHQYILQSAVRSKHSSMGQQQNHINHQPNQLKNSCGNVTFGAHVPIQLLPVQNITEELVPGIRLVALFVTTSASLVKVLSVSYCVLRHSKDSQTIA